MSDSNSITPLSFRVHPAAAPPVAVDLLTLTPRYTTDMLRRMVPDAAPELWSRRL